MDINKLKEIMGKPMSFPQICEALNLPNKRGNAKAAQLKELEMYCEMDRVGKKYIITKVYDMAILGEINNNDKFQKIFEAAIYHELLRNGNKALYLSYMNMLMLFNEVNKNFKYVCNRNLMAELGEEYLDYCKMGEITYKILKEWTKRRLEKMAKRGVILKREGFRVYKRLENGVIITKNAPIDSTFESKCIGIYNKAIESVMPKNWNGEWVSSNVWDRFERKISELTKKVFEGAYDDLKKIIIISPAPQDYIQKKLEKIYKELPELSKINFEACDKILKTTTLDEFSMKDRKMFIELSIREEPLIDLRDKKIKDRI